MTCSQCKDECDRWETCEGCRACRWLLVCNNAYKYLSDAERGERMRPGKHDVLVVAHGEGTTFEMEMKGVSISGNRPQPYHKEYHKGGIILTLHTNEGWACTDLYLHLTDEMLIELHDHLEEIIAEGRE